MPGEVNSRVFGDIPQPALDDPRCHSQKRVHPVKNDSLITAS